MILNFSFKNFLSFAEDANVSMVANSDKSHINRLYSYKNSCVSRAKLMYGANASGKTSFMKALDFFCKYVENSNLLIDSSEIPVKPFKFRNDFNAIPTEFCIEFVQNGIKYAYGLSCTKEKVLSESLVMYLTSKPTSVFVRKNTNEYDFKNDKKILNDISKKTTDNKLFLTTSATWNYAKTKPVVDYILNNIVIAFDTNETLKLVNQVIENCDYDDYKQFCLAVVRAADSSINNIKYETKKLAQIAKSNKLIEIIKMLGPIEKEEETRFKNTNAYNFTMMHEVEKNSDKKIYELNLREESLGTRETFMLSFLLYDVIKKGKVLFVDELDKSLHTLLVKNILNIFLSEERNSNGAQLIANTHDTNLIDLDLLRRDEIIFVEKDINTATSSIYPLSAFSPRKDENIERAYLLGRFGSIPYIGEDD